MSASDRERHRLKKLAAILRENHVTPEDARREERSGPLWARREEWARRPGWKITTKRRENVEEQRDRAASRPK
jgi:hypothetical protein